MAKRTELGCTRFSSMAHIKTDLYEQVLETRSSTDPSPSNPDRTTAVRGEGPPPDAVKTAQLLLPYLLLNRIWTHSLNVLMSSVSRMKESHFSARRQAPLVCDGPNLLHLLSINLGKEHNLLAGLALTCSFALHGSAWFGQQHRRTISADSLILLFRTVYNIIYKS